MKKSNFFRKYHKWIGIIISLFILLFTVSGVILNHRKTFSTVDLNRSLLPQEFQYNNWNLSAVKSTLKLSQDSILIYGNIGIYLSNSDLSKVEDFNSGFEQGIDNRKIETVYKTKSGKLLASTIFNLFEYSYKTSKWKKIVLPFHNQRIVDITEDKESIIFLTRSELIKTSNFIDYELITLPSPASYNNEVSLFKTLWVLHSGEIYGDIGRLIVDFGGIVFSILVISGVLYVLLPKRMRKRRVNNKSIKKHRFALKYSVKWHNKLGWTLGLFLIFTTITGMFLRPPLLIPIANSTVSKIPYTELDTPNAWFDKLRQVIYFEKYNTYFVASIDGIYYSSDNFKSELKKLHINVPISIMGVNVFEEVDEGKFLLGSFSGLFELDIYRMSFIDYTTKKPFKPNISKRGSPIGDVLASGFSRDFSFGEVYFDYNNGLINIDNKAFAKEMPEVLQSSNISLWNTALEFHTARIFRFIMGDLYILLIPLLGIFTLIVLISGYVILIRKKFKI